MHEASVVIARPQPCEQLVLIFHGVGSSAQDLAPLGRALAQACPGAAVVSVQAPYPSQLGRGQEWFSVIGVSEDNRPGRIAQAMPQFVQTIRHWQDVMGIDAQRTVLVGFSQGAIMSLEGTQMLEPLAGKVIAMAGRFAQPVRQASTGTQVHLIHGEQDGVVLPQWSVQAHQQIRALGGAVTLDLLPGLGHGIDDRALQLAIRHLASPEGP
jgi:phospholipase/carboxylesterase